MLVALHGSCLPARCRKSHPGQVPIRPPSNNRAMFQGATFVLSPRTTRTRLARPLPRSPVSATASVLHPWHRRPVRTCWRGRTRSAPRKRSLRGPASSPPVPREQIVKPTGGGVACGGSKRTTSGATLLFIKRRATRGSKWKITAKLAREFCFRAALSVGIGGISTSEHVCRWKYASSSNPRFPVLFREADKGNSTFTAASISRGKHRADAGCCCACLACSSTKQQQLGLRGWPMRGACVGEASASDRGGFKKTLEVRCSRERKTNLVTLLFLHLSCGRHEHGMIMEGGSFWRKW